MTSKIVIFPAGVCLHITDPQNLGVALSAWKPEMEEELIWYWYTFFISKGGNQHYPREAKPTVCYTSAAD